MGEAFSARRAGVFQVALNSREERLAENQRAFRIGNERLRGALETTATSGDAVPFLCECMDDTCIARVDLTLEEYEAIRRHENRFVIVRNHPTLPRERVVQENSSYQVVEK
jgi:hypothetical protein